MGGWIAEPGGDEEKDKFPVDSLVKELKNVMDKIDSECDDYHGQSRTCCDGIRKCFVTIERSFSTVKLQAIGNQNMHAACRRLTTDLEHTQSCIVSYTGHNCHGNVNTETLSAPFHERLDRLQTILDEKCSNLPPEETTTTVRVSTTTTTSRKTSTSSTTSSTTTTTTTTPKPTTVKITSTTPAKTSTPSIIPEGTTGESMTESSQNDVTEEIPIYKSSSSTSSSSDEPGKPNHPTNNRPGPSRESTTSTSTSTTLQFTSTSEPPPPTNKSSTSSSASTLSSTPTLGTAGGSSDTPRPNEDMRQGPGSDNTIIYISSAVGSVLFLSVIVLCIFIMYKKRQQKNTESGGSLEPDGKPRFFSWLFKSPKNPGSVQTDTEIYAEIDEAFMEAVYKYDKDKEKPNIVRDRISSNSQFNMCYESSFNDDDIITSKDKLNATESNKLPLEPLNPLALIRKDDDAITSFQTDQPKAKDTQNNANALTNAKKGFVTRRRGFTDLSDGDYVYIEAQENDSVFIDEQNYAVPSFGDSEYDTAEYGRNPDRNISQVPEENYYSYLVYNNEPNASQNAKEYRRSSSDVETHVYENQDTLMEY